MLNVASPLSLMMICSGSSGSTKTCTFTPLVPGCSTMWGSNSPSLEYWATTFPLAGVPDHTKKVHSVVVVTLALLVAKIISATSSRMGKTAGSSVQLAAATSCSAKPAWTVYCPPPKSASVWADTSEGHEPANATGRTEPVIPILGMPIRCSSAPRGRSRTHSSSGVKIMGIPFLLSITSAAPHTSSEVMNFSFKTKKEPAPQAVGRDSCVGGPHFGEARTPVVLRLLAVRLFGGAQLGAGSSPGFANIASLHLVLVLSAAEIAVRFG